MEFGQSNAGQDGDGLFFHPRPAPLTMPGAAILAAALLLACPFTPSVEAALAGADAVVLVNSQSARYGDFTHFIQPYLHNFGFPYVVQDIATNAPGPDLAKYAVIIIGHRQLDTNHTYLTQSAQTNISLAVSNGTGLVNFDSDLSAGGIPQYQFIQDIFGFSYGSVAAGASAILPPTEPGLQMHFVTARHPANDAVPLRSSLSLPGMTLPATGTALAWVGGQPLVSVARYGEGRAVQWASYGWMNSTVLGPADGLDDVLWRGVVWAARKPFVMRGMPNFVTMRVDDVDGPLDWVHAANAVGFKPFLAIMMSNVSAASAADLRGLVTNGNATATIHSFTDTGFFYFNHQLETANPDIVQSNYFYLGTQWHASHGIPMGKICATHYSELGPNCFAGLKAWGIEYVPIEVVPGTVEYATPGAAWVVGGPYRLYEAPQPGQVSWPTYYADWLSVPGHPEFDGQFFNIYSEVRDASSCGEWCPDNDVGGSISRGTTMLKRSLDSLVMATLFSHEWYIHPTLCCGNTTITSNNWRVILQGITNNLAAYQPVYVTLDHASQYVRATRTSRLLSSAIDAGSGRVTVTFSGKTDLDTGVYVFTGADTNITSSFANIPAFVSSSNVAVALSVPPTILNGPASRTNNAGTTATFSVAAGGAWPLTYRWYWNGTNVMADDGRVTGAGSAMLTINDVVQADAGTVSVVISNAAGSVTSTPPAMLTVVDPAILSQPADLAVAAGATAFFNVVGGGTSLTYQWLKNGAPITNATHASLTLTNVSADDAGSYRVAVTSPYGSVLSSNATLKVFYTPAAVGDSYVATAGAELAVAAPGILGNDTVAGGGSLGAALVNGPIHGTLILNVDGGFTYTPLTNHVGTDSFTYEVVNGPVHSSVATVTLSTTQGGVLFSDGFARLSDPGPLSPWATHAGSWAVSGGFLRGGTNALQSYGSIYLTNTWSNYSVEARIQLSVKSAWGGGIGGRVNPASGAKYALWIYPEDSAGASNVLRLIKFQSWTSFGYMGANNIPMAEVHLSEVGTNWHSLKLAFLGSQIAAFFEGKQVMNLTDTEATPYGSGGISADLWTGLSRYQMSVSDVFVRPLVVDDSYSGTKNHVLGVSAPGVLANDTGVAATNLEAALVSGPIHGVLSLTADGHFTYTPATDYYGPDSFSYKATQGTNELGMATVKISVVPDVPVITQTPTSQTNQAESTAVFSVVALGTQPFAYQWYQNGTKALNDGPNVSGAHGATLTINQLLGADAGSYTVVITNQLGSVTSAPPAVLTVIDPVITSQPANQAGEAGAQAIFRAGVAGSLPVSFQWYWNVTNALSDGSKISGSHRSRLVIASVMGADAGSYTVVVRNALGGVTSAPPALLTVIDPIITNPPVSQTNLAGSAVQFSVGAYGTSPSYQWLKGGLAIGGATRDTLALGSISAGDAASYSVVVSNMYGAVTTPPVELVVVFPRVVASVSLSNFIAMITWNSVAGRIYRLQYKNLLTDPEWKDALPDVLATASTTALRNFVGNAPQRFYRVVLVPLEAIRPRIISISLSNTVAAITWNSVLNQRYRLQWKENLSGTNWNDVLPEAIATGPTMTMTHESGNAALRFYRVAATP